jgi:tagatose-1,6-bisphosphate aldolase non-catalytic subunit AgaZ/GatZ
VISAGKQRHYSYSDRIRYYWGKPSAVEAVRHTLDALRGVDIPETLLRQFIPGFIGAAETTDPEQLLEQSIDSVLAIYDDACSNQPEGVDKREGSAGSQEISLEFRHLREPFLCELP